MAIADQITRIQNAKAAIKTAIEGKGVTVGDGTIDTYAEKINQIVTGDNTDFMHLVSGSSASLTIPAGTTSIRRSCFYDYYALKGVTIPNSVTNIGVNAFCNCTGLLSITIPNSVTAIGAYAFQRCTAMTHAVLPANLTSVEGYVFDGCSKLQELTIPAKVTTMKVSALTIGSSTNKATITMKPTTPPTIQSNTIGANVEKIIVPATSLQAYKTAPIWSNYASIIEADGPVVRYFLISVAEADSLDADVTFKSNGVTYTHIKKQGVDLIYSGGDSMDNLTAYTRGEGDVDIWSSSAYQYIDVYSDPNNVLADWVANMVNYPSTYSRGYKIYETWILNQTVQIPLDPEGAQKIFTVEFLANDTPFVAIGLSGGLQNKLYYNTDDQVVSPYTEGSNTWLFPTYRTLDFLQDIHDGSESWNELIQWLSNNGIQVTRPTYGSFQIAETPTIDDDEEMFYLFEAENVEYNRFYYSLPGSIDYSWGNFEGPSVNAYSEAWNDPALRNVVFKIPPTRLYTWLQNNANWEGKN